MPLDFPEIMNAHDVTRVTSRPRKQLTLQSSLNSPGRKRVRHHFRANDLDRNCDRQLRIPCLIHGAHAANTKHSDDVIAGAERLADYKRPMVGMIGMGMAC